MTQPIAAVGCIRCLCEVCNRMRCPKHSRLRLSHCISKSIDERCPVLKCSYFDHMQKRKVYRVVRREKKRDKLIDRLETIEGKLDALTKRLTENDK